MLFGDAATATLVEYSSDKTPSYFVTGARGAGWDKLIAPAGGHDIPIYADIAGLEVTDSTGNVWRMWDDIMKGMEIFKFSTDVGPKSVTEVLALAGCKQDDVDYFAFHQANKQIVRSVAMYLGLPADKFSTEAFRNYGNCGVAAVVTDVCHNLHDRKLHNVCITGFGVGLSWASVLLDMSQTFVGAVETYATPEGKMTREEKIKYWISYFKGE
jgi:3-oxoacyl-[acyl-carrier-protein] synthase-3